MLSNLSVSSVKPEPPSKDGKDPIKIRLVLFYDGTLNNRTNVEQRELNTNIYQKYRNPKGPTSYDNGRTNIAIMEPHLIKASEDYYLVDKAYIEGQGTIDKQKDTKKGYALGGGKAGVVGLAKKGASLAVKLLAENRTINAEDFFIEELAIDVLGFSRGAAAARYAIHLLLEGNNPIYRRLQQEGYAVDKEAVSVRFAGLYDTVLSYYGTQYVEWTELQQKSVALAETVIHLAAADEHRLDFALINISSAKDNGGKEYFLPGAHSDVGGSYNQANEEELKKETREDKKVYMVPTQEIDMEINRDEPSIIQSDIDYLVKQGWYTRDELTVKEDAGDWVLIANRKDIHSAYSNIPLKIMAKFTREAKLEIDSKLDERANIILKKEPDLEELENDIQKYLNSAINSGAEDWIGENAELNNDKLKAIRHKHFNFSAKVGIGYYPRMVWDDSSGTDVQKKKMRKRYETFA